MRASVLVVLGVLALGAEPIFAAAGSFVASAPSGHVHTLLAAKSKKGKKRRKRKGQKDSPAPGSATQETAPPVPVPSSKVPKNLPEPPPLAEGDQIVALLPLRAIDVTDTLIRSIEVALFNEVDEREGLTAVSPQDVLNDLSAHGFDPAVCEGEIDCLAKAGRYARCHLAIETRVAALGGTLSVSMRLVDTESGAEVGRVADPVSEDDKLRAQEIHRLAVQLLAPDTYVGSLAIESAQAGAEVYVDDHLVGTTPMDKRVGPLAAGPHILRVSKPGFADLNQFVDVVYKRNVTIKVDLENATLSAPMVAVVSKTGFGSLYVLSNEPGVEVRIDGEPAGVTPLEPIERVVAGQRRLSFRKEGFEHLTKEIDVVANRRTELAIQLYESGLHFAASRTVDANLVLPSFDDLVGVTRPVGPVAQVPTWSPGWKFWTGVTAAGLGVVSLAVSSGLGATLKSKQSEALDLRDSFVSTTAEDTPCTALNFNGTCKAGALADLDAEGNSLQTLHFATLGSGIGLLLIGGGFALWDIMSEPAAAEAETQVDVLGLDFVPGAGGGHVVINGSW